MYKSLVWLSECEKTLLSRGCSQCYAQQESIRLLKEYGVDSDAEEVSLIHH
jgi:hypothetical protein